VANRATSPAWNRSRNKRSFQTDDESRVSPGFLFVYVLTTSNRRKGSVNNFGA
jgi:hypothetical protein